MADEFIPISQLPAGQAINTASGTGNIDNFAIGGTSPQPVTSTLFTGPAAGLTGTAPSLTAEFALNIVYSQIVLTVDGSNRIAWDVGNAHCAIVTITADSVLQVPSNMEAGGKYDLTVIASNDAQLVFEGDNIYQFNIGSFPFFEDGKTILEFNSDGTNMACVSVNTGYAPFTSLEDSLPNTWYTTRKASAYTGTPTNITALNDFGSNTITATKSGTGNIVLTDNALNTVAGFDFGSANTNRIFSLGTVPIGSIMSGGNMSMMAMVKTSSMDNVARVIFGWINAFNTIYLGYDTSTTQIDGFLFTPGGGTEDVVGNASTIASGVTLLTWIKNSSGSSYLYANGVLIGTATQTHAPTGSAVTCWLGSANAGGLSPLQGSIGDFVIWNRALSTTERTNIEIELMSIYGVV